MTPPPSPRLRLARARRAVRRAVLARRRALAGLLVAVAALSALRATRPPEPPSEAVLVAAHDLAAGTVLGSTDLVLRRFATGTAPTDRPSPEQSVGRTLAAPLRAGEALTDVRLVGAGLLDGYPGLVALPLRVPDAGVVALLRPGDRVDVLATEPRGGSTARVATDIPVLALPTGDDSDVSGGAAAAGLAGRLVLVGVSPDRAPDLAGAAVGRYLTVTLLH